MAKAFKITPDGLKKLEEELENLEELMLENVNYEIYELKVVNHQQGGNLYFTTSYAEMIYKFY